MSGSARQPSLEDAFQELVGGGERPDAVLLEEVIGRYPQFAAEITDFAVEWVLQDELPVEDSSADDEASAVAAAMRRARERLDKLDPAAQPTLETPIAPFAERSPAELTRIAANLGLDKTLMAKLRDRKIVAESIPGELRDGLATQLEVPISALAAHLAGPATIHLAASFKATGKPTAGTKETFAEAVRRSTLPEGEKNRWLSLAD